MAYNPVTSVGRTPNASTSTPPAQHLALPPVRWARVRWAPGLSARWAGFSPRWGGLKPFRTQRHSECWEKQRCRHTISVKHLMHILLYYHITKLLYYYINIYYYIIIVIYIYIYMCVCVSVGVGVCLSIHPSICLSVRHTYKCPCLRWCARAK